MIIQHNLEAMNANRQFGINSKNKAKSSEKLSSGYKINRAADDAAGLAISEKMRRQIRGLRQGESNIQDGISFLQVADGALDQVHDMLQRVNELAVKAANDTLTGSDRKYVDDEVQQIKKEIERIGSTTLFNEKRVFYDPNKPSTEGAFFSLLGNNVSKTGFMDESIPSSYLASLNYTKANQISGSDPYTGVYIDFGNIVNNGNIGSLAGTEFYVNCCTNCCPTIVKFVNDVGVTVTSGGSAKQTINIGVKKSDTEYYSNASDFNTNIVNSLKNLSNHVQFACEGNKLLIYDIDPNKWSQTDKQLAYFCDVAPPGKWIQMSSNVSDGMFINTGNIGLKSLGIANSTVKSASEALETIENIKSAIDIVSYIRSDIGALQNRLEHSYRNNCNTEENVQASESRIRDADMADEVVKNSKEKILEQANLAISAQANQSNKGVLSLIQ